MKIISEYIKGVMDVNPVAGSDLLVQNYPHVARELRLPPNIEEATKLAKDKIEKRNARRN